MAANVTVKVWKSAVKDLLKFIDEVGQYAEIQTRKIVAPSANSEGNKIVYTTVFKIDKMAFTTPDGKTTFDSVGVERRMTEIGYLEYESEITSEMSVLFQGNRLDILNVNDIGDLNGILKLELQNNGSASKEASKS